MCYLQRHVTPTKVTSTQSACAVSLADPKVLQKVRHLCETCDVMDDVLVCAGLQAVVGWQQWSQLAAAWLWHTWLEQAPTQLAEAPTQLAEAPTILEPQPWLDPLKQYCCSATVALLPH
jgi:hypothetical protein